MKIVKYIVLIVLSLLAWTALINFGTYSGHLLRPIAPDNTSTSFIEATKTKLENDFVGNLAMVLLEDGEVSQDFYHSVEHGIFYIRKMLLSCLKEHEITHKRYYW